MIAGILLAAGQSHRFGSHKLVATVDGHPLVYYSVRACLDSDLPLLHIVVDANTPAVERAIASCTGDDDTVRIVRNTSAASGLMSSLKTGLRSLPATCEGAVVALADMPRITPRIINALLKTSAANDRITVAECAGRMRHPRVIPRRFFDDFLRLSDSGKGTDVLRKYRHDIVRVPVGSEEDYWDIDTEADLRAMRTGTSGE